jgi:hypothetical protein
MDEPGAKLKCGEVILSLAQCLSDIDRLFARGRGPEELMHREAKILIHFCTVLDISDALGCLKIGAKGEFCS